MAALDTVVNTFGGQWFNMQWQPQLTSPAFTQATNFYVNLIRKYGEPGAANDSFNQLLTLYGQGKCAMWYDATVAATSIAGQLPVGVQEHRVRVRAAQPHPLVGLAVDLGAGHPPGRGQLVRRLEVRVLGHLEELRPAGREEVRLGRGPAGHQDLAVQQPAVPAGRPSRTPASPSPRSTRWTRCTRPCTRFPISASSTSTSRSSKASVSQVAQQIAGAIAGTESVSQALKTSQADAAQYTPAQLAGG